MGNAFDEKLQRQILVKGLKYLETIEKPGTIVDLTKNYLDEGRKCLLCGAKGI
jgi:hypothetical protein